MTTFGTQNIPTQFAVQFLSFAVSTVQKYFGRILTTFPDLSTTGVGKVENGPRMTQFSARNTLHTFWGAILIVSH